MCKILTGVEKIQIVEKNITEWSKWFSPGSDANSLNDLVCEILYDRAISLCYEDLKKETPFASKAINDWALRHYAKSQILNISKLCEHGSADVYSLRAILEELRSSKDSFCLDNLMAIYHLFDVDCEKFRKICNKGSRGYINKKILLKLEELLDDAQKSIKPLRDKQIAHSATKSSRLKDNVGDKDLSTSIPIIDKAIDNILIVYSFLNNFIDSGYIKFNLTFKYWDTYFNTCDAAQLKVVRLRLTEQNSHNIEQQVKGDNLNRENVQNFK